MSELRDERHRTQSATKLMTAHNHVDNTAKLPTIAIVGRPNVGKSTLFNRLIGSRRAIVGDESGITRDRLYGVAQWNGRRLRVIDTGGIIPQEKETMPVEIFRQARVALEEADAVVMVVDGRSELASSDIDLARLLMRTGKLLYLAVNKIDVQQLEPTAEEFRRLGIRNLFAVSAEHGNGVAELLDDLVQKLPPAAEEKPSSEVRHGSDRLGDSFAAGAAEDRELQRPRETKVAIVGRPNVGKSTLLNQLTGSMRAIVSPTPGTTRDAVDELVQHDGAVYRFVDTAGIRRKGKTELMAEKLAVVMARKHMEAADVVLAIIDAAEGVTALDATIAGYAHESGRSVIIVVNKWDLVLERARQVRSDEKPVKSTVPRGPRGLTKELVKAADQKAYESGIRDSLKFLQYAPVLFISATTGRGVDKLFETIDFVAAERRKRVTTAEMNRFLEGIDFERAPVPYSRRVKILYMTQAAVAPPVFVLFTDKDVKLHFSYERYLENQIRRAFGFVGTPIRFKVRPRRSKS